MCGRALDSVYVHIGVIISHPFRIESRQRLRIRQQSVRFPLVQPFLQDKGAEYRGDLLYERAKAEFDARMEELAALPPKEILDHAYEKIIKEDFLCHLEEGLDEWETDALLSYPQPLTALYTEWMGNDYSYLDIDRIQSTATQAAGKRLNELRRHEFDVNGEPPVELRYFYDLHSEILDNPDLEWVGDMEP